MTIPDDKQYMLDLWLSGITPLDLANDLHFDLNFIDQYKRVYARLSVSLFSFCISKGVSLDGR